MRNSATGSAAKPHLSLYRKISTTTFADVVGQDHIVDVLKQSVEKGTVVMHIGFVDHEEQVNFYQHVFCTSIGTTPNDLT